MTTAELEEAVRKASPGASGAGPTDEQLAAALVDVGLLNRWQADQLLAGRSRFTLGPYRMLDSLGQGGMGQIFKAEHTLMGRTVAVKVLPRHRSSPEAIASFHREIRAQAKLDHENLVRALDAGHDGNVHYLVTELVPGTDLRRLVRNHGRLDMATAASIVSQAAIGLTHAHAIGLIHRDVKPGNILVTPAGKAKVSDLGLADFFDATAEKTGKKGRIVGTADYLSPEQISAPDHLTPASDIYSLGCTLYYAVTGKVPFPGGGTRERIYAHLNLQPIDPRRLSPELDDAFVDVIAAMMAKKPGERIATGDEVVASLAPWAGAASRVGHSAQSLAHLRGGGGGGGDASSGSLTPPPGTGQESDLGETLPSFPAYEATSVPPPLPGWDSRTENSDSTLPIVSAEEETRPSFESREILARVRGASSRTISRASTATGISPVLLFLIGVAAAVGVGSIVAIVRNLF